MWVARNKDNSLRIWFNKPKRSNGYWLSNAGDFIIDPDLFPELTWEDEPLKVTLIGVEELKHLQYKASQAPTVPYMG